MAATLFRKHSAEDAADPKSRARKRFKKQKHYSSDSESEDGARDAPPANSSTTTKPGSAKSKIADGNASKGNASENSASSLSFDTDSESDSAFSSTSSTAESQPTRTKPKRHDPSAFAASLKAILNSKVSSSKRADPVLVRSRDAHDAAHAIVEGKLDAKAQKALREERRIDSEKGRVKDVLLGDPRAGVDGSGPVEKSIEDTDVVAEGMSAGDVALLEKRLRKTAQRGVVRLFNAVRAAQVRGEEEARKTREKGLVGMGRRKEKVSDMGRKAFLDLVGKGGEEVR